MPSLEFVGQSRRDADNPAANPARLLNLYRRPLGGESNYVLMDVLGQDLFADIDAVYLRAVYASQDAIFACCGGGLYRVTASVVDRLGTVLDGTTTIRANNGKVTIAADGTYYVWNGMSLSTPTGGAFSKVGSLEFIGNHTVLSEKGGRRFMWTEPATPGTLDALDFATAEDRDDNIIRPMAFGGNLWVMKETSIEVWWITDSADSTERFVRLPGGVIDKGLKSYNLATRIDGGIFFVANDGVAYKTSGAGLEPVSTPAIHTAIERGEPARCFRYFDEGHEIGVIRFRDRPAWCCDFSNGNEWHERASGVNFGPWEAVDAVEFQNDWHTVNDVGRFALMTRNCTDIDGALVRRAVSKTLSMDQDRFVLGQAEAYAPNGVSDLGRDATLTARFSKDGGRTWGVEKPRSLGGVGDYQARAVWKAQGQFRTCTMELTLSDPMSLPIEDRMTVKIA